MAATTSETEAAPGGMGRALRIGLLVLACLLAGAGGVVFSLGPSRILALLDGEAKDSAASQDGGGLQPTHAAARDKILVTPFQEIIVNITATTATGRQTSRFLKLNLALAYDSTIPGAENIETRKLFLRDSFQEYLRQLNEADLQGSMGLVQLKAELLRRARAISDSEAPQEFLIADLVIQ
ncbi:flagellar basal body-associated FliL family protein [Sagittula salina]|uniref:Flagellar protein FliL n=1 Tax=Sagittula salina TaxID=2820268 RepID=A0A940S305_9RHOB|nr:flagellar basal body-associated FliL family protein [Sagittula salina]MBP0484596.1 flagellar basal body-associated FliL family protein [Sagittula salina]